MSIDDLISRYSNILVKYEEYNGLDSLGNAKYKPETYIKVWGVEGLSKSTDGMVINKSDNSYYISKNKLIPLSKINDEAITEVREIVDFAGTVRGYKARILK